jgi:uncharacterized membrane protein YhaH (DUF805 family)
MDWQTLFLKHDGRIGQKDYWIGALILFVIWMLSSALHLLAPLIWLALVYPWVCLIAKRLHDFGKSAWLILVPLVVACICGLLAVIFGGVSAVAAFVSAAGDWTDPRAWGVFAGALGLAVAFVAVAGLVKIAFLLWVGLRRGDVGPNLYGPPPVSLISPRPTPVA